MLPGLSNCAKRNSAGFDTQLDALDELLSEAWTVIRSFPIERRDRYVIKNLLRDCEYRAFLKTRRRMLVHEVTDPAHLDRAVETDDAPATRRPSRSITIVELLGRARTAGMSDDDVDVVVALLNTLDGEAGRDGTRRHRSNGAQSPPGRRASATGSGRCGLSRPAAGRPRRLSRSR